MGTMPKALKVMLAAVSIILIGRPIVALASPVMDADIRGKTICWSSGAIITYSKDGFFYSAQVGNGKWRLVGNKLTADKGVGGRGTLTITKQGETFLASVKENNAVKKYSGKYCN